VAAWDAGWEDADQAVKHARSGSDDFLSRIA